MKRNFVLLMLLLIIGAGQAQAKTLSGSQFSLTGDYPLSWRGTFFSSLLNPSSGGELERFHLNTFYGTLDEEALFGLGVAFPTRIGTWGFHFINFNTEKDFIGAAGLFKMTGGGFTYTREIAEDVNFGLGFKGYTVETINSSGFIVNADLGLSSFFKLNSTPIYWSLALNNLGLPTSLDGFESFAPMGIRFEIQPRLNLLGAKQGKTKPFVSLINSFVPAGMVMSTGIEQEIGVFDLGAGVSFDVYGENYQEQGLFFLSLKAEHDFGNLALSGNYTFYPAADYNLDDKKETKHLFSLTLKFGSVDRKGPEISVKPANLIEKDNVIYISPNNDNINDYLAFGVELDDPSMVKEWKFQLKNQEGKLIYDRGDAIRKEQFSMKSFGNILKKKRSALVPAEIFWPGLDENGKPFPDGVYTYQIVAVDFKGNESVMGSPVSPKEQTVVIDTQAPQLKTEIANLRFSPNGDGAQDLLTIKHQNISEAAHWSAQVKAGGAIVFRKEWEGKPDEVLNWDGKNEDGKALPDGTYEYSIHAEDKAGNQFQEVMGNIVIDTRIPEVKAMAGDNYFSPNGDKVKDTVMLLQEADKEGDWIGEIKAENGQVVRTYTWKKYPQKRLVWDGKNQEKAVLPDGKYDYYLKGSDLAGNTTQSKLTTFIIDNTPPKIKLSAVDIHFSPNQDGIKDFISIKAQEGSSEDFWKGEIRDRSNKVVRSFYWNDTPPESVQWDGLDKEGKKLPDGEYQFVIHSQDRAGNTYDSSIDKIVLDNTPPEVALASTQVIFSPNGDGRKDSTDVKVSVKDANKALLKIMDGKGKVIFNQELPAQSGNFIWDGKNQENKTVPDGSYMMILQAEDEAGNKQVTDLKLTVLNLENKLMLLADRNVINPRNQDFNVIEFSAEVPQRELIEKWSWKLLDGEGDVLQSKEEVAQPTADQLAWKFGGIKENQEMLSDGLFASKLIVSYKNGDVLESNPVPFRVDKTGPEVKLDFKPKLFSPDGDGDADLMNLYLDAEDPSGIQSWYLVIEDRFKEVFKSFRGGALIPEEMQWDGKANDGQLTDSAEDYYLYAIVSDGVGNVTKTARLPFTIDILVMKTARGYKIRISNIQFDLDKATLKPQAVRILERVAEKLKRFPNYQIKIEGHADKTGPEGWNEQLSLMRAESVKKYLVEEKELDGKMFQTEGFGSRIPLYPNDSAKNRAKNRRVEFILVK